MDSVNNLLNRIDAWGQNFNPETNENQTWFKRNVATRFATVVVGSFLDITAMAKETFTVICVPPKFIVNTLIYISDSACLDSLDRKLPSTKNLFATMYRIAAYAIGVISSVVVGFWSPSFNFKIHYSLGLVRNINDNDQEIFSLLQQVEYDRKANDLQNDVSFSAQLKNSKIEAVENEILEKVITTQSDTLEQTKKLQELVEKEALDIAELVEDITLEKRGNQAEQDQIVDVKKNELDAACENAAKKVEENNKLKD